MKFSRFRRDFDYENSAEGGRKADGMLNSLTVAGGPDSCGFSVGKIVFYFFEIVECRLDLYSSSLGDSTKPVSAVSFWFGTIAEKY